MNKLSRIIILAATLALIAVYFVPFWSIYLIAPQYPEGLSMQIWLNKLSGQVEIINGLNHYIGMRHIEADMFPEFSLLVYIVAAIIAIGVAVAIAGKRKLLLLYIAMFVAAGIAALVDFYQWTYDYGHNLDPHAAIQVPGLSYQPPLIGHKKLLNFDAFSYPDTGAWIAIGAMIVYIAVWLIETRKRQPRKEVIVPSKRKLALSFLLFLLFVSCRPQAEKITVNKDACDECRMTIVDARFASEIVTKKGRVFKFDDAHCIAHFLKRRGADLSDIHQTLFVNYIEPSKFINVSAAQFVVSSQINSPMGGNAIALANRQEAEKKSAGLDGSKVTNWSTLYNILVK